jgi:hypothetical protein
MKHFVLIVAIALMPAWVLAFAWPDHDQGQSESAARPRLVLRVNQHVGLAPVRIALAADLVGGADDYQEFYCPTIRWDWDDGTESESTFDCRPYRSGVTEIIRHFSVEHVFAEEGQYHVTFRLTRRDKELASAEANVLIQ